MFLVLDVADVDRDMALARHVTLVHQNEGVEDKPSQDKESQETDDMEEGRDYLK